MILRHYPITKWMNWEGGVDLAALTVENAPMPNVIVHVARMVHTPVGSAPSGMILLPDASGTTQIMGFVSSDKQVGDYFAAHIFAGTPFENAPTILGEINIEIDFPDSAKASISVKNYEIVLELSELAALERVSRQSPNLPFHDDSLEAAAGRVKLTVNGAELSVIVPPVGLSGGAAAVYSAAGFYSR